MRVERIGAATLYCGDARHVCESLEAVDFIFTDPPYGHNNNNNGDLIQKREQALGRPKRESAEARPILNDGAEASELVRWLFRESRRLLRHGGCCCCCGGGGGPDPQFARWSLWMDEVLNFKQMVVWDKGPIGMGWHYRRSYETVLVGEKPGAACRWFDESNQIENIIRPGYRDIRKIIPSADEHPTEKPWQLAAHFIALHTERNDVVLDPFMGSGSTGVGAIKNGRRFVGIELDDRWFDLACRRIEAAQRQSDLFIKPPSDAVYDAPLRDLFKEAAE